MAAIKENRENSGHSFEAYFKRATSPLVVLRLLSERSMYGYEMIHEMRQRSGGAYTISLLYPVLYRLEGQGYVCIERNEVVDGRARSYYAITEEGRVHLDKTWKSYKAISSVFLSLMEEA